MSFLKLKSVSKSYENYDSEVKAIQNIDLDIEEGEFVVILGKSGSGKSTLLSLISGLENPTNGKIMYNNIEINKLSQNKLAKMRRNNIGIIFQHFYLLDSLTAYENIELPLIISGYPSKNREIRVRELLNSVGLIERASHYPNELSGGERQRIAIARALANQVKIIIADEPTGDLDSETGGGILSLLRNLNKGEYENVISDWKPTIVMVTHDTSLIKDGMRVITLSDGSVISDTFA